MCKCVKPQTFGKSEHNLGQTQWIKHRRLSLNLSDEAQGWVSQFNCTDPFSNAVQLLMYNPLNVSGGYIINAVPFEHPNTEQNK